MSIIRTPTKFPLVVVLLFVGLQASRTFAYDLYRIPSSSMYPGLVEGDRMAVAHFAYGYGQFLSLFGFQLDVALKRRWIRQGKVKQGDVVVFVPRTSGRASAYVKRVIGLPGDKIEYRAGRLYINGARTRRVLIRKSWVKIDFVRNRSGSIVRRSDGSPMRRAVVGDLYQETLPNGRSYRILACSQEVVVGARPALVSESAADLARRNTRQAIAACRLAQTGINRQYPRVPTGHYFFLGDNRNNSADSRYSVAAGGTGFVSAARLLGRAELLLFSTDGSVRAWEIWRWFGMFRRARFFRLTA